MPTDDPCRGLCLCAYDERFERICHKPADHLDECEGPTEAEHDALWARGACATLPYPPGGGEQGDDEWAERWLRIVELVRAHSNDADLGAAVRALVGGTT